MIRPRKRFGQHFLHDSQVIANIINAINPQPGEPILEIGPGLGAITGELLKRAQRLEVIEIDRDVIPVLRERMQGRGELIIHEADALNVDLTRLAAGRRLRICGNLPYNISTPLLFHLLEAAPSIADMHFMLQKEVVDRMAAHANDDAYGRLSVMIAVIAEVESLFDVGPESFTPAPRVQSSVVRLRPRAKLPFAIPDRARFARVVSAAFGQRRKTLRNSLKGQVDNAGFISADIDPIRRAETLSPEEFGRLALTPPPRTEQTEP